MKYKVGDKVKIRYWSDMEQEYGLHEYGYIELFKIFFTSEMKDWCGKIVTIKEVCSDHYEIKEDGWNWTDQMIDHSNKKTGQIKTRFKTCFERSNCVVRQQEVEYMNRVAEDIINLKILTNDEIKNILNKFYKIMRKHNIKQGIYDTKNSNARTCNNFEWTMSKELFLSQIRSQLEIFDILHGVPEDLQGY